jgi:hypothetical protein
MVLKQNVQNAKKTTPLKAVTQQVPCDISYGTMM